MSEKTKLEDRISELEKKHSRDWLNFGAQYLLAPVLVLGVGYFLNSKINETRLAINQVEAVSKMTDELFSETPARVLITVRLLSKIVDKELSDEITNIVVDHYSSKLQPDSAGKIVFTKKNVQELKEISVASQQPQDSLAAEIMARLSAKDNYIVVASVLSRENGINFTKDLRDKGYDAEMYLSSTGYYGITIGHADVFTARKLLEEAQQKGDAPTDAYLHDGRRFQEKIYPQ